MTEVFELHTAHYAAETVIRYEAGVRELVGWLRERGVFLPRRSRAMDRWLCTVSLWAESWLTAPWWVVACLNFSVLRSFANAVSLCGVVGGLCFLNPGL